MSRLRIAGGHVVDPANGVDGVLDVWIDGGRVVTPPDEPDAKADRTIDARGYVVMPAGVDVHCHIAGPKVNAARMLRPEEGRIGVVSRRTHLPGARSGTLGSVPSSLQHRGQVRRAGLRHGRRRRHRAPGRPGDAPRVRDTPIIDKAFLVLLGNNHYCDGSDQGRGARSISGPSSPGCSGRPGGFGVKVVNPGGVEAWKQGGSEGRVATLDDVVPHFGSPLGRSSSRSPGRSTSSGNPAPSDAPPRPEPRPPGNASTTLETLQALDGHRAHLAHIQFHSATAATPTDLGRFDSAGRAAGRLRQRPPPGPFRRRRPGPLRRDHEHDRRRRRGPVPPPGPRAEVGQPRPGARDRLRGRADHLRRQATPSTPSSGPSAWSGTCASTTPGGSP